MKIYLVKKSTSFNNTAITICVNGGKASVAKFRKTEEPLSEDRTNLITALEGFYEPRNLFAFKGRTVVSSEDLNIESSEHWHFVNACIYDASLGYGRGEVSAHAMWGFNLNDNSMIPFNSFSKTFNDKSANWVANRREPRDAVLYLPFSNSVPSGNDATLQVFVDNPAFVSCLTGQQMETVTLDDIYRMRDTEGQFLPGLTIEEVSSETDGTALLKICVMWNKTPVPSGEEVFVTTTAGYINKQRVELDSQGVGYVKWMPLGLTEGDKATVQAGFRLFSGIADITLEV